MKPQLQKIMRIMSIHITPARPFCRARAPRCAVTQRSGRGACLRRVCTAILLGTGTETQVRSDTRVWSGRVKGWPFVVKSSLYIYIYCNIYIYVVFFTSNSIIATENQETSGVCEALLQLVLASVHLQRKDACYRHTLILLALPIKLTNCWSCDESESRIRFRWEAERQAVQLRCCKSCELPQET